MNIEQIAVTGSAGFIGSHLVDALLAKGFRVKGMDNLSMGKKENFEHNLQNPRFRFYKMDVLEPENLKWVCRDVQVIVHLAASKIPRYGNRLQTVLVNNIGTHHVLEAAKEHHCKLVMASTSDVYGKNPKLPFNEESDSLIGPSAVKRWSYAVSKLFDEHLCFAYQEAFGIPVVNLRFFGSYGPRHHLSWWGGPQSVFISQILKDQKVTIHGDGQQTRSFTYISDTVEGIVAAITNERANGEVFNIGSTYEISILNLAKLIHRLAHTGKDLKIEFVPYSSFDGKYEDVRRRVPDVTKAKEILGVVPKVDLQEGIARTIRWQEEVEGVRERERLAA